ncbi:O-antigen ligase family protein [uncultured Bacteroides sp.]|uniref:O-antigen ligase family protein n=1 Tax=uncultured Bacteroides sp. TaxID=162156 RepID=UPI0037495EE3
MAFAILPFAIFIFLNISIYVEKAIYALFISQFILLIAAGFFDFPLGIYNLVFSLFIISLLIIYHIYKKPYWKNSYNGMLLLYSIWALFCVLELGNPNNVQAAWNISITHYAFYPILCALLVPMAIKKPKDMEWLFIIWSIFILIVAAKGYWQKNHGFNEHEYYFLYDLGGAKTHLIWSGIRYFSYFPDAANFGVHMAMGTTAFSIAIFYVKNIWLKFYYIIVVAAAIYGMGISGTRAAMAVPFGGLALFIILSKNKSGFIIGTIAMISLFFFFRFTAIGDGNQYIRKMRSAFYAEQDASYQVRMVNREKMKVLMASKPFGYGIGLGGKAERFHPKELMPYPPDSWLVNVWTDTGIVGLSLYLLVNVALFAWCCWILLFKIKDKRLKGLLTAWLCMNAGYFVSAFANDVMQYPNSIVVYVGFALCFAGTHIDKAIEDDKEMSEITVK